MLALKSSSHHHGERLHGVLENHDLLGLPVVEDREIRLFEVGNETSLTVRHHRRQRNDPGAGPESGLLRESHGKRQDRQRRTEERTHRASLTRRPCVIVPSVRLIFLCLFLLFLATPATYAGQRGGALTGTVRRCVRRAHGGGNRDGGQLDHEDGQLTARFHWPSRQVRLKSERPPMALR